MTTIAQPAGLTKKRPYVVTGGSGFIGSNLCDSLASDGEDVVVVDNLSRPGVEQNLAWLQERHGSRIRPMVIDVRDVAALRSVIADAKAVFHMAAQTAVTTSLVSPVEDFEVNARGTLNVLEAIRLSGRRIPVVFSSTNKVYGSLEDLEFVDDGGRYAPADLAFREHGIGEERPLDFCTPYGCSKGVADQYVLDYAKSFGIPSAVLRMSCIYGPRQFGTEDQGWVAHFLISALKGEPITIYGDGRQVRDILHVSDAVAAYRAVLGMIETLKPRALNLGGGPANAVSLKQVLDYASVRLGRRIAVRREGWRTGDQLYFVADTRRLQREVGWRARMGWQAGIDDLASWLTARAGAPRREQLRKVSA